MGEPFWATYPQPQAMFNIPPEAPNAPGVDQQPAQQTAGDTSLGEASNNTAKNDKEKGKDKGKRKAEEDETTAPAAKKKRIRVPKSKTKAKSAMQQTQTGKDASQLCHKALRLKRFLIILKGADTAESSSAQSSMGQTASFRHQAAEGSQSQSNTGGVDNTDTESLIPERQLSANHPADFVSADHNLVGPSMAIPTPPFFESRSGPMIDAQQSGVETNPAPELDSDTEIANVFLS